MSGARRTCARGLDPARGRIRRNLSGRVAAPPSTRIHAGALHQERVGVERRPVLHDRSVVDERTRTHRAPVANRDLVRLEGPVLKGMALQMGAHAEGRLVADADQRPLGDGEAVVEHAPTDRHPE